MRNKSILLGTVVAVALVIAIVTLSIIFAPSAAGGAAIELGQPSISGGSTDLNLAQSNCSRCGDNVAAGTQNNCITNESQLKAYLNNGTASGAHFGNDFNFSWGKNGTDEGARIRGGGILDGAGHTIRNTYTSGNAGGSWQKIYGYEGNAGVLMADIEPGGVLINVNLIYDTHVFSDPDSNCDINLGFLAGRNRGMVANCTVNISNKMELHRGGTASWNTFRIGGLVGINTGNTAKIVNSTVNFSGSALLDAKPASGWSSDGYGYVGGAVGHNTGGALMEGITVNYNVSESATVLMARHHDGGGSMGGYNATGGVLGRLDGEAVIRGVKLNKNNVIQHASSAKHSGNFIGTFPSAERGTGSGFYVLPGYDSNWLVGDQQNKYMDKLIIAPQGTVEFVSEELSGNSYAAKVKYIPQGLAADKIVWNYSFDGNTWPVYTQGSKTPIISILEGASGNKSIDYTTGETNKVYTIGNGSLEYCGLSTNLPVYSQNGVELTRTLNSAGVAAGEWQLRLGGVGVADVENRHFYPSNDSITGTLTITPRPVEITFNNLSTVYGEPVLSGERLLRYSMTKGSMVQIDGDASALNITARLDYSGGRVPAGTYGITAEANNDNYNVSFVGENKYKVEKRKVQYTMDSKESVYGEPKAQLTYRLTSGSVLSGDEIIVAPTDVTAKNVGKYSIVGSGSGGGNNYDIIVNNGMYTITKRDVSISISPATSVYGDALVPLDFTAGELVDGDSKQDLKVNLSSTVTGNGNVGSYPITAVMGEGNYNVTVAGGENYVITAKEIKIDLSDFTFTKDKFYDGTDNLIIAQNEINGITGEFITLSVAAAYESKDAGERTITITAIHNNRNYIINGSNSSEPITLTDHGNILPKRIVVGSHSFTVEDKVYDGTTDAVVKVETIEGVIAGDSALRVTQAAFNSKNVAGVISVTVDFEAASVNYALVNAGGNAIDYVRLSALGKITPRPISAESVGVVVDPTSTVKPYDGGVKAFAYLTFGGNITFSDLGEPVWFTLDNQTYDEPDVGKRDISADVIILNNANYKRTEDYRITFAGEIKAIDYDMSEVVFDGISVIYDGESHGTECLNLPVGLDGVAVSASYVGNGVIDNGVHTVTASFTGSDNYNPIEDMQATVTIAKRAMVYTVLNADGIILGDGSVVTVVLTEGELVKGHTAVITLNEEVVGDTFSVTASGDYVVKVAINDNYGVTVVDGEFTVEPMVIRLGKGITAGGMRSAATDTVTITELGVNLTVTGVADNFGSVVNGFYVDNFKYDGVGNDESKTAVIPIDKTVSSITLSKKLLNFSAGVATVEGGLATLSKIIVPYGETVVFTAEAYDGYEFAYWTSKDKILSADREYSLKVLDNVTLTPVFVKTDERAVTTNGEINCQNAMEADCKIIGSEADVADIDIEEVTDTTAEYRCVEANEESSYGNIKDGYRSNETVTVSDENSDIREKDGNIALCSKRNLLSKHSDNTFVKSFNGAAADNEGIAFYAVFDDKSSHNLVLTRRERK